MTYRYKCCTLSFSVKSPQKSLSASPLSAAIQTAPSRDIPDRGPISQQKPKAPATATAAAAPKPSLFSDEEDNLFGSKSVEETPNVEEKKEVISLGPKPRKPVGAVSMFGGVDLFAGKKPSYVGEKGAVEKETAKKEEGESKSYL